MIENGNKRLDSWKEISEYLGRDIRTAMRWEQEKGLPVHRVPGGKRQLVFGFTDEIDSWLKNGSANNPLGNGREHPQNGAASDQPAPVVITLPEPPAEATPQRRRWARRLVWGGIGLVSLAVLGLGGYEWRLGQAHRTDVLLERQLTSNPLEDTVRTAAISPDGKHVAYFDSGGLFVRATDSGETRPVPLQPELRNPPSPVAVWFPDGGKLLALGYTPEGTDIWMIPMLGAASARMLFRFGAEPAISPDGRSVAFVNGEAGKIGHEIWVGAIDGQPPRKLATSDQYLGLRYPVWSPDGRWIAYWRNRGLNPSSATIEARPAGGGPARILAPESSLPKTYWLPYRAMTWSPDWRLIFGLTEDSEASSGDGGIWALQVEAASGEAHGKPERLARWSDCLLNSLTISADGRRLAFVKAHTLDDVYLGDLERGGRGMNAPRRLTLDTRGSQVDSWALDSRAIFYESSRNGRWEVFKQGLNDAVPEMAVSSSGRAYSAKPSPDGVWLLYWEQEFAAPGGAPRPMRLMRRAALGGPPETILEEPFDNFLDFECPAKPGAAGVISGRGAGNEMVFSSLDPVRGKVESIAKIEVKTGLNGGEFAAAWSVSPNGSELAFVDAQPRIEVFSRSDSEWREIPIAPVWGMPISINWAADGSGFYAISRLSGSCNVLHITAPGEVNPLLDEGRWPRLTGLVPSPDGKHLAFTAETFDSNVWMIENF